MVHKLWGLSFTDSCSPRVVWHMADNVPKTNKIKKKKAAAIKASKDLGLGLVNGEWSLSKPIS